MGSSLYRNTVLTELTIIQLFPYIGIWPPATVAKGKDRYVASSQAEIPSFSIRTHSCSGANDLTCEDDMCGGGWSDFNSTDMRLCRYIMSQGGQGVILVIIMGQHSSN